MRLGTSLLVALGLTTHADGFTISTHNVIVQRAFSRVHLSQSASGESNLPKYSRLEGNQRPPTSQELEIMDEMIMKLANAKPYDLPNAVRRAFRVISSPQFFLRIATLSDETRDDVEKAKLQALASNLVTTLETVVETTEEQLDERAKELETVVKAASEPDSGEFLVPLTKERLDAMRTALLNLEESSLDEGFLSTLDAWMNKSHQDGMDLMVGILQKVLQMYAGLQIGRLRSRISDMEKSAASELFEKLLETDADDWDQIIRVSAGHVAPNALKTEIQRNMEKIVLSLDTGSMAQRCQAEYLKEMVKRVETIEKTL